MKKLEIFYHDLVVSLNFPQLSREKILTYSANEILTHVYARFPRFDIFSLRSVLGKY